MPEYTKRRRRAECPDTEVPSMINGGGRIFLIRKILHITGWTAEYPFLGVNPISFNRVGDIAFRHKNSINISLCDGKKRHSFSRGNRSESTERRPYEYNGGRDQDDHSKESEDCSLLNTKSSETRNFHPNMILNFAPHFVCLAFLGLFLFRIARHFLDPRGLRQYPAPSIAGFSSLWRIYHTFKWKHYAAVHQAHQQLGSHVRIAPNHISILDPRAPQEIYGHGANMMKDIWYDAGAGPHRNLADVRDKAEHQAKRKMFAHTFAAKTVIGFEPQLRDTITSLMHLLDRETETKTNMRRALNYFLIDLFGKLLYGYDLGCLERNDDLLVAESKDGRIYRVPFIQSLLDSTVINNILAITAHYAHVTRSLVNGHPYKKAGADWENIIYYNTKKRLANPAPDDDLFQCLLQDSKGQELKLSFGEIMAECSVMMNAGTETSTAAMTSTIFLLCTNSKVLQKLRDEIKGAEKDDLYPPGNYNGIPSYEVVSKLPYLRACIEEALRLRPPSSFGLPRIVPKGGRSIANKSIPEGVTVSVPTYSILRDELVFKDASEYNPDRWLTDDTEEKKRMMNNHIPFSTGPRACIGRNISYFEQAVVIATIVKLYDADIDEDFQLETQERFNSNPGDLPMAMRRRVL